MGSSESDDNAPTRKRTRTNNSNDDRNGNSKKQRGRPRVDTQDETAADRRRTQIRLAQRAYRQRKETTISALKGRVTTLESAIDEMNRAFLSFNDSAMNSGILTIRPELARELKKTTETFVKLARDAAKGSDAEGDDMDGDVEEVLSEQAVVRRETRTPPKPSNTSSQSRENHVEAGWGYTNIFDSPPRNDSRTDQELQMASFLASLPNKDPQGTLLPFGLIDPIEDPEPDTFQQFHVRVPSPSLPLNVFSPSLSKAATIQSPYTYSFQEPTFARRLQRAAIERGFHLLSTSESRPGVYKHVFKLALLSQTREQIVARFRTVLTRSNVESLDYWQTPYIHLGGAGTHYPQRDNNGNIVPKPNSWSIHGMGPFPPRVRFVSNTGTSREMDVDLRGFEGEWFDPHDVQGYLEEKGCVIDPHSSFAEVWMDAPGTDIEGPLAMDLSTIMGMPNHNGNIDMTLPSFFGGDNDTPVSGTSSNLSSSRSSSGSDAMLTSTRSSASTGTSTPLTPHINDLGFDLNGISATNMFPALEIPSTTANMAAFAPSLTTTTTAAAPSSTPATSNKRSSATSFTGAASDKPNDQFSFETGGLFNGNGTDWDNMFDVMSPRSELGKQQRKRLVTVDVNKLIEELTKRGVCLGRSPGFRRTDVDNALSASVIHAF